MFYSSPMMAAQISISVTSDVADNMASRNTITRHDLKENSFLYFEEKKNYNRIHAQHAAASTTASQHLILI